MTAESSYPNVGIAELFERQAARTPDAVALLWDGGEWSYLELNRRANLLARRLHDAGIKKDHVVAVCVPRCPTLIAALLGVLKAGGAYLPLDYGDPPERLAQLSKDAKVEISIVPAQAQGSWLPPPERVLAVADEDPQPDPGNLSLPVEPDDLAYVMYTSGSTGFPKGVEIPHKGVVRLLFGTDFAAFGRDCVFLHHSPAAFDASTLEIWAPLLHGGRCALFPNDAMPLQDLAEWNTRFGVNTLWLTSSLFNALIEAAPQAFGEVRHVMTGGEALSAEHIRRAQKLVPRTLFTNAYGPTENTTFTCCYPIPCPLDDQAISVPIGRPIANTTVHLLDNDMQPVPAGEVGEIYAGGDGLARGYRNRLELTAELFLPDPFSGSPGARLYRTGDLARLRPDGNLEFLGRRDHQVKLRGFRIELEEVEAVLSRHPAVAAAAAVVQGETALEKRLVAFVSRQGEVSEDSLRQYLVGRLPSYMVPSVFAWLDKLPLTSNGKLNRRQLERLPALSKVGTEFVAPQPGLESDLARIAAEVLRLPSVGVTDNFFHCGGHSLLAMQFLANVSRTYGGSISLRDFYREPTVAALRRLVERQPVGTSPSSPICRSDAAGVLSFAQQRLWISDRIDSGGLHYLIPWVVDLRGALDVGALRNALDVIVARHEPLRTVFPDSDGVPEALILPQTPVPLKSWDVDESEWRQRAEEDSRQAIDLSAGPILRAKLYRLSAGRHILLLIFHHIAFDGWSLSIFRRELNELYAAHHFGRPPQLANLPVRYSDYAIWQRENWHNLDRSEALNGSPDVLLLTRPRPKRQSYDGRRQAILLDAGLMAKLRSLSREQDATLFMTLLAGFLVLLFRYSGQADIIVGTPTANRSCPEIYDLIGFFVNTLVVRTSLAGDLDFSELVTRVRESVLDALSHQDVPFEKLVEARNPERRLSHSPLFQVMFILQNVPPTKLNLPGLMAEEVEVDNGTAMFDLTMTLEECGGEIRGSLQYSTDLFDSTTAQRMTRHYVSLLQAATADSSAKIAELPLMDEAERSEVLRLGRGPLAYYPQTDVGTLFSRRAANNPDAIALVTDQGDWTYGQLNQLANGFAGRLAEFGVEPEEPVGICVERSPEMVAALLGILKAGAAYLPLDPAYPARRLSYMMENSGTRVVVARRGLFGPWFEQAERVLFCDEVYPEEMPRIPVIASGPDRAMYILYTSGSTGTPKGVAGEHRAVMNRLQWMWSAFPFDPAERCSLKTSLNFVDSVWEIFGPLLAGVPAVVISDTTLKDAKLLVQSLAHHRVTRIVLVPSLMRAILDIYPDLGNRLPDLRYWTCSGETLTPELAERFLSLLPGRTLLNLYGSSEVCADVTWHEVQPQANRSCVPIGKPIANTELLVLDENRQMVPIGTPGELYVGGPPLARGYWRNPEFTAQRFLRHPIGPGLGLRVFRTGDRVRFLANGDLEFLGRVDNQVKIRGQRIELDEISAVLRKMDDVLDAVVIAGEVDGAASRLIGFVVWKGTGGDSEKLRERLRTHLPEVMVPSSMTSIEALPLLPNGKVDRERLIAMKATPLARAKGARPLTVVEQQLCELWRGLLQVRHIDPADSFFDLGGNSLQAIRLCALIERELGQIVPAATIFEAPTLEQLGALLGKPTNPNPKSLLVPIQPGDTARPLFCLHLGRR